MKTIGLALISISFLVTTMVASMQPNLMTSPDDPAVVNWLWFVPALILGVIGIFVVRLGEKSAHTEDSLDAGMNTLNACMHRIAIGVRELEETKSNFNVYDLPAEIDRRFLEDLGSFAEARKTLIHLHDLDTYAEVMNSFAAGERYLNRVWSASIDGWVDEAAIYLGRARIEFEAADTKLRSLAG